MRSRRYGSDLTDAQWQVIKPLLAGHRPIKHHPRHVLDALLYLAKTGCQWRYLPDAYPPWQSVTTSSGGGPSAGCSRASSKPSAAPSGARQVGSRAPRRPSSTANRSRRATPGERGFDGAKLVKGRKRHILTDTLGLLFAVLVHRADINDSQRAPHLLDRARGAVPRLRVVFADEGYAGTPAGLVWRVFGWRWSAGAT